jgi:enediyne biosynthesis protein E4
MKLKNGVRFIAVTGTLLCGALPAVAGVTFQNIAAGGGAGLSYGRTPSLRKATLDAIQADGRLDLVTEYGNLPVKTYGGPGVAVLDYDKDGDLDIYVTNGPGTPNSLFRNRLKETGHLSFQDVAQSAGVALTSQDSNGVCFGDIENDGDLDLYVTGYKGNRLLENRGNGTFRDITTASGTGGQTTTSVSCAMGDVNGDGLLDLLVANTFDFANNLAYNGTFGFFQHNQLLVNQGNRAFADQTDASGIKDLAGLPEPGVAIVSWAVSLIDVDLDGDLDAVVANDDHANYSGFDVGFLRLFRNDGSGHFTDDTFTAGLNRVGEWHGLAFGDLNCDGRLDIFGSNVGDYIFNPGFFPAGAHASRWLLGQSGGTFTDPGVGALVTTPHGWGAVVADYDNDGDSDVIYHGGWEFSIVWDESNPGVVLNNPGCSAHFTWDSAALAATNHLDRNVEGVATGDFNNDGFVDVVSVASFDVNPGQTRTPLFSAPLGSIFDPTATMYFIAQPSPDDFLIFNWQGFTRRAGSLAVEINSGNGNRWAAFNLVGSRGLVDNHFTTGRVNRDGIGGIVRFTPQGGQPTLTPVLGGSSYASQNSLTVQVGMGSATRGTVEVLWPGGVKNRLYNVFAAERLTLPEIPCSFDAAVSRPQYLQCVTASLVDLVQPHGPLTVVEAARLELSAIRAYEESH